MVTSRPDARTLRTTPHQMGLASVAGTGTPRTARPWMSAEPDLCLLCLLLIVCPPAGIAWWLLARRRPSLELPGAAYAGRALRQEGLYAQDR